MGRSLAREHIHHESTDKDWARQLDRGSISGVCLRIESAVMSDQSSTQKVCATSSAKLGCMSWVPKGEGSSDVDFT